MVQADGGRSPITYRSKAHAAYQELRSRILSGDLEAGASLNQEQLAVELGVSTTPLREALRSLESEGLVRNRSHRDVIVAPLDPHEMLELYEVRRHLDGLAARLAAQNADEEARRRIEEAATEVGKKSADPVAANRRFHRAIYLACGNDVLIELLDALWNRSDRYRRFIRGMADRADVVAEHRELADTVLSGDGDRAERLMLAHVQQAINGFQAKIEADELNGAAAVPAKRSSDRAIAAGKG